MTEVMNPQTRARLMLVSAATLCTALFKLTVQAPEMTVFEDFVGEQVAAGRSILGLYPPTDEAARTDFAAWRLAQGR